MKLSFKGDKKVKKTKRARDPTSDDDGEGASSSSRRKSKKRDEISNPGGKKISYTRDAQCWVSSRQMMS